MPITAAIVDPNGLGTAEVRGGALCVTVKTTAPTESEAAIEKNLTGLLTTAAGVTDFSVDGSSASVEFLLAADNSPAQTLRTIESVRLVFHSTNMQLTGNEARRFGPVTSPGLPNGLKLTVCQRGVESEMFLTPVKVIGDFYRYAGGPTVGINTAIVNDINAISSGVDLLMVLVVLSAPVALFPGTTDSIKLLVQDDLTGIDLAQVQYYGKQQDTA